MKKAASKHAAARTLLLVGEGDAEVAFLGLLKALYVHRGSGVAVTIKNAHGKGAENVIDVARRQCQNKGFDAVAALFDTDVGWNDGTRKTAKRHGIFPLLCTPCLEALLLGIAGVPIEGLNTDQLKNRFKHHFGCDASALPMPQHFNQALIEQKASDFPTLANLVHLLKAGKAL
jgi:hypothetical protein